MRRLPKTKGNSVNISLGKRFSHQAKHKVIKWRRRRNTFVEWQNNEYSGLPLALMHTTSDSFAEAKLKSIIWTVSRWKRSEKEREKRPGNCFSFWSWTVVCLFVFFHAANYIINASRFRNKFFWPRKISHISLGTHLVWLIFWFSRWFIASFCDSDSLFISHFT